MEIRSIVEASPYLGQGNPDVTSHPMTRQQCRALRARTTTTRSDEGICGAPNMVALFDPEQADPPSAKLCIDQFEFPNIACEYPVVWVRASEAARICRLLDKRLCDAHEWEGACAGKLRSPAKDYESYVSRFQAEALHNQGRERVWATGLRPGVNTCATGAQKSPGCVDASWERCGANTYPAGAFPRCVSPFGVYDLHGNVAEHMNLPLNETQLGSRGGSGETEMKGSWFAFDEYHPHPDDCRWRAPAWHATPTDSETSHFNYHLGFRCCRDLE
jgi:formylglycine-generating enzyme required for sulfatase activity